MHIRGLSCLDSLVHSNVGVLVYLSETKLKRGSSRQPLFLQPVNLAPLTVIISYVFLGSYPSFLYAASKAPRFRCSCMALQYAEEALVKPLELHVNFVPVPTAEAGFTGLLVFQIRIQGSLELLAQ